MDKLTIGKDIFLKNEGDLFENLAKYKENYDEALKDKINTQKSKKVAIDLAIAKINDEYQEREAKDSKALDNAKDTLDLFLKDILLYSTFPSKLIGIVFEYLIKIFSNQDFVYENGYHVVLKNSYTLLKEKYIEPNYNKVKMLIKKDLANPDHEYCCSEVGEHLINKMVSQKNAILIEETRFKEQAKTEDTITFYKFKGYEPVLTIDFNNFEYLKDYINFVIQYRYENNIKTITKEILLNKLEEFILINKEIISENNYNRNIGMLNL